MAERQRFCLDEARERLEEEFRLAEEDYNVEFRASDQDESLLEDEDDIWDPFPDSTDQPKSAEEDPEINRVTVRKESAGSRQGTSENDSFGSVVTVQSVTESCESVAVDSSFEDKKEEETIQAFIEESCCCSLGPKKTPCSSQLSLSTISQARNNCLQLSHSELDLVIMAQIHALRTHPDDKPTDYRGKTETFRFHTRYYVHGLPVCKKTFAFVHTVGKRRVEALCTAVDNGGVVARIHGSCNRPRHNELPFTEVSRVCDYIRNIATTHGLPLPGRLPNQEEKVILLPSDMPKSSVYRSYKTACSAIPATPVGRSTFYDLWNRFLPYIGTTKPSSDLCFECQKNVTSIIRSAHLSEDEKSQRLQQAEQHLRLAKTEREWYNRQIEDCKATDNYDQGGTSKPSSMHYSFDYAQQVHYPNDPQQPGPVYFLSTRKCQIFGVCCEPLGRQVNYLIDEAEVVGKGANATVSLLHHYLNVHSQKEQHLMLHADNCVGQNKNNCLIQFLLYLVLMGFKKSVVLSFMIPGHTKFSPDRHFGLVKKSYKRTRVDTIDCVARVVEKSSLVGANSAQLIVNDKGDREVLFYDWSQFLSQIFKTIPEITSYYVFRFDHQHPGTVFVRESSQSEEKPFHLLKAPVPRSSDLPPQILPKGLDLARQWYLHEKIAPFCSSTLAASISCPRPQLPKPSEVDKGNPPTFSRPAVASTPRNPAGTKRTCSHCRIVGHTKRTCPELHSKSS